MDVDAFVFIVTWLNIIGSISIIVGDATEDSSQK